jgi:ketosteroid isomerase-like protein
VKTLRTAVPAALAATALLLAACSQGTPPAAEPTIVEMPEERAQALARLLDEFDPVGFYNLLAENVRLLPPNMPAVEGRQAVVDYYKGAITTELDFEVTPLLRVMIGNVGLAEGTYKIRNTATNEYIEEGKYMTVWVNQDGEWKVARMMTNTDHRVAAPAVAVGAVEAPAP